MWDQTFKRWLDLVFWWLPKHEVERPAPQAAAPAAGSTSEQAVGGQKKAARDAVPDDLTVIKGIGPVVQEKLHALGIRTFGDLAAADPAKLVEQLKGRQPISEALVRGWTKAADQRTAARH
jgi:predicted flap endonuclease-1-like 5' DNA nuclease